MCGVFGIYVFLDLCVQLLVVRWHGFNNCIDKLNVWAQTFHHGVPSSRRIQTRFICQQSTLWARYEWNSVYGYPDSCILYSRWFCNDTIPALFRHHDENDISPYADVLIITFDFDEGGILFSPMQAIRHLESTKNPISDSDDETDETGDVIKCSIKATEMSLQCESCGTYLELYQRRR